MIRKHIEESIALQKALLNEQSFLDSFDKAVAIIYDALRDGHKLLIAGNGGSAAQAQHFAAEFVGKYDKMERHAHSAIALSVDTSILTAWSNDYHFNFVFSRQVEAHGRQGDIFIGISTSGNSANIVEALNVAKTRGLKTIAFLGKGGGKAKGIADVEFIVPESSTARTQEVHTILIHALTDEAEQRLHTSQGTSSPSAQMV